MSQKTDIRANEEDPRAVFSARFLDVKKDPDVDDKASEILDILVRRANGIGGAFVCTSAGEVATFDRTVKASSKNSLFADDKSKLNTYKYLSKTALHGLLTSYFAGLELSLRGGHAQASTSELAENVGFIQYLVASLGNKVGKDRNEKLNCGIAHLDIRGCVFLVVVGAPEGWEDASVIPDLLSHAEELRRRFDIAKMTTATRGYLS